MRAVHPTSLSDDALPTLETALDRASARSAFESDAPHLFGDRRKIDEIRVLRHKPGRRCLIAYDLSDEHGHQSTVLGKIRGKGVDREAFRVSAALRAAGMREGQGEAFVPHPVGLVPTLSMWLQSHVPGEVATRFLDRSDRSCLARSIARAIERLQRSGVRSKRVHTLADELGILSRNLLEVVRTRPTWAARIDRLLRACHRIAGGLGDYRPTGIHRDFYPDQVLVGRDGVCIVDLDLYSVGDPALDVGNFLGHVREHALRRYRDPAALCGFEEAFNEEFLRLHGAPIGRRVTGHTILTLARHVAISNRIPERRARTADILETCERELGLATR